MDKSVEGVSSDYSVSALSNYLVIYLSENLQ